MSKNVLVLYKMFFALSKPLMSSYVVEVVLPSDIKQACTCVHV